MKPLILPQDCARDAMVRFVIARDQGHGWRWATFSLDGAPRAQGHAATRQLAAALVIRDIIQARTAALISLPEAAASSKAA